MAVNSLYDYRNNKYDFNWYHRNKNIWLFL